jgi:UDP-glucose 4-epimerase
MVDDFDGKEAVVTGGLGFVGSNLTRRLVHEGASVTVLDARLDAYGSNEYNLEGVRQDVDVVELDVRDGDSVREHVAETDYVFHLAAQLSRPISMNEPVTDLQINCEGTLNVLDAAAAGDDPPKVLFTSSQAVYGRPNSLPLTEQTPPNPLDMYGAHKLAGENYTKIYRQSHGVDTTVVRLTNVYGPRAQLHNPNYGVIQRFIRRALTDDTLTVFEPGTMLRDFVFIEDVVEGLLSAITTDERSLYLVSSGESTSILELAERIVETADSGRVELTEWPEDWDSIKVGDIRTDPSQLSRDTGWEPTTGLEDGLPETLSFYEENREEYLSG